MIFLEEEYRAFCPTGEGGGVKNDCSSEDGGQSSSDDDETQIVSAEPFTDDDDDLQKSSVATQDGRSVPVVSRSDITTGQYLLSLEATGKRRGLAVSFGEAKELQQGTDISEDDGPYAAFVRDGYVLLTDNELDVQSNSYETIDLNGVEFGTLDDEMFAQLKEERLTDVINAAWDRLDEDELEAEFVSGWASLDEDKKRRLELDWKSLARESPEYEQEAFGLADDERSQARHYAVAKMREQLERDLARTAIDCCIQMYRGIKLAGSRVDEIIKEGKITHTSANSWTTSREIAMGFHAGYVLLVCRNPAVGHVYKSNHSEEDEITRPPSSMKITGVVKTSGGGTVLFVDEDDDYKDDDRDGVLDIYQK